MSKDCIKLLTNNNLYSSFSQSAYERAKEFSVEKNFTSIRKNLFELLKLFFKSQFSYPFI